MKITDIYLECGADDDLVDTMMAIDKDNLLISLDGKDIVSLSENGVQTIINFLLQYGIQPVEDFCDWDDSNSNLSFHIAPIIATEHIAILQKNIAETIEAWEEGDFGDEKLDSGESDWLDETLIEGLEETALIRERFNIEVLLKIGTTDSISAYEWGFLKEANLINNA